MSTEALDVERALVGISLNRPRDLADLEVIGDDFTDVRLGALWDLMLDLEQQGHAPSATIVRANLHRLPVRGISEDDLIAMITDAPIGVPARPHAIEVRERGANRRLAMVGRKIVQLAESGGDSQEIAEMARAEVDASSRSVAEVRLIGEEIDETLAALSETAPTAISTPWPDLDFLLEGWRPGGLYIIGARPAVGKSILGLQAAVHLAETGHVAFHSLEMPRTEVHTRVIAQLTETPMTRMSRRQMSERDWKRISDARAQLAAMPLAIDDRSTVRPVDIRSHARTLARRGPVAAIVVDYLQLMSGARGDRRPRHEQVGEWSRQLKILAKELSVPVIALSQLNRQVEGRTDKRPTMADLRESGSLEQDADVILLLHVDEDADPSTMHVLVAKNRQGATGPIKLERRGDVARLEPYKWRPSPLSVVPDEVRYR